MTYMDRGLIDSGDALLLIEDGWSYQYGINKRVSGWKFGGEGTYNITISTIRNTPSL